MTATLAGEHLGAGDPPPWGEGDREAVEEAVRARRETRDRARELRGTMSLPEALLWKALRKRQAQGCLRFRRQHPIGPYVIDFYCDEIRLAVEIDGQIHTLGDHPLRDASRDAWLAARGVRTLRIDAGQVLASPESVATAIAAAIEDTTWLTDPKPATDAAAFDAL